ncbi:MAG TPA: GPR endopeptidase [Candidatus Pullichristensenella stercoripullorum]|nr:GPR endopeptidase [Candidatus Pullichristensenella stercoripullorum]
MRQIRTDLAMESFGHGGEGMPGVHVNHWEEMGVSLTEVVVETEEASRALGKAVGVYMTLECPAIRQRDLDARLAMANLLGEEMARMLPGEGEAPVLVIGLGNRRITPDSLGPQTIDRTLVTRHMFEQLPGFADERMRSVCALAPGVLGVTGIETMEMVEALVAKVRPRAILCVDSLAARAAGRIGTAIQLTDTGIQPGSGVGNHRRSLTRETLGVPVIAVGMPTVIYAATLTRDAMETLSPDTAEDDLDRVEQELLTGAQGEMVVTPREIDEIISDTAGVIATAVNRALQPDLSQEEIMAMMS